MSNRSTRFESVIQTPSVIHTSDIPTPARGVSSKGLGVYAKVIADIQFLLRDDPTRTVRFGPFVTKDGDPDTRETEIFRANLVNCAKRHNLNLKFSTRRISGEGGYVYVSVPSV